jgi:hypothetical protein
MEIKKKYKDLNFLVNSINGVIGGKETKVQQKLVKIYEKFKAHHESYNAQRDELRLDNAATDDKGILLVDEKGEYKFTKDGIKNLTKNIQDLNEKEFDFKPIEVINTKGLEGFLFLKDWTTGIPFIEEQEEEL